MSQLLDVMTALGPVFTASRLLGKERVRAGEVWALRTFKKLPLLIPVPFMMSFFLLSVFVMCLLFALPGMFIRGSLGMYSREPTPADSVLSLLLAPVVIPLNLKLSDLSLRFTHRVAKHFCHSYRNLTGDVPPWPLSLQEGTYKRSDVMRLMNLLPVLFSFYALVLPLILAGLIVVLAPLWAAERLRARFTPETPIFSDIVAYCITLVAVVLRLFTSL